MIRKQTYGIGFSTHEVIKKCNTVASIDVSNKSTVKLENNPTRGGSGKTRFRNLSKKVLNKGIDTKEQNKTEVLKQISETKKSDPNSKGKNCDKQFG